jgi:hypothetical protein
LIEKSLTLDLELVFDQFPREVFNTIGDTFQTVAGIPIFLSQSVYLLAAGAIAKIVGTAGEALFDGRPVFTASDPLNIYWPGEPPLPSGFALVTDGNVDNIDKDFRRKYKVNAAGQVVDDAGNPYGGMKDGQPQPLGSLLDAVKLYNDFTFRQEIDRLDKQIESLPSGEEKDNLMKKREALAKNILTDLLKKA